MNWRTAWPLWVVSAYVVTLVGTTTIGTVDVPVPPAPRANLLDKPFGEDAFYMFTVARHLAGGEGMVYHGEPTTGVQPLATFAYAAIYRVTGRANPSAPLRGILALNLGLLIVAAGLAGRLVAHWLPSPAGDTAWGGPVAATLVGASAQGLRLFGYGLETGFYLVALCALLLTWEEVRGRITTASAMGLGVLVGLCTLVRVDFAVIATGTAVVMMLARRIRARDAATAGAAAIVTVAPWLLYVRRVEGTWMPSSGAAQAGAPADLSDLLARIWSMTAAVASSLTSVVYAPGASTVVVVASAVSVALGALWLRKHLDPVWRTHAALYGGIALLAVYYVGASTATHFYARYLAPLWLLWTLHLAAAVAGWLQAQPARRAATLYQAGCVAILMLSAVETGYALHRGQPGNEHLYTSFYVERHATELGTVGAFQSGLLGYRVAHVVNLDGKVDRRALDWPRYLASGRISRNYAERSLRPIDQVQGTHSLVMRVERSDTNCPSLHTN